MTNSWLLVAVSAAALTCTLAGCSIEEGRATATAPPAPDPSLDAARVAVARNLSLQLPPGWVVYRNGGAVEEGDSGYACVTKVRPGRVGCDGLMVFSGAYLPGYEGGPYQPHQPAGWYHGTDVGTCPGGRPSTETYFNALSPGGAPVEQGTRPVGDHEAAYDKWAATCDDGSRFSPQAWYLADDRLLVETDVPRRGALGLLASARFDPIPAPEAFAATLTEATTAGVRLEVAGKSRELTFTHRTACLAITGPENDPVLGAANCKTFVGKSMPVTVYAADGAVLQLAQRS